MTRTRGMAGVARSVVAAAGAHVRLVSGDMLDQPNGVSVFAVWRADAHDIARRPPEIVNGEAGRSGSGAENRLGPSEDRSGGSPDRTAAIVRAASDRWRTRNASVEQSPYIVLATEPGAADLFTLVPTGYALGPLLAISLGLPAEVLEAEARLWQELRTAFPTASVMVDGSHLREVTVSVSSGRLETGAMIRAYDTLTRIAPPAPETAIWRVLIRRDAQSRWHLELATDPEPYRSNPGQGLRPDPLVGAMQAIADVTAGAPPGREVDVRGSWLQNRDGGAGCLAVSVWLRPAEFEDVPIEEIRPRIAGSATERLGAEYLERLESSGLAFALGVDTDPGVPVVEAHRCAG